MIHSPVQWTIVANSRHHDDIVGSQLPHLEGGGRGGYSHSTTVLSALFLTYSPEKHGEVMLFLVINK